MNRLRNALRDAPQGVAPAVFLILALLVAASSVGSHPTGTTARMDGHVEGPTINGTGIALTRSARIGCPACMNGNYSTSPEEQSATGRPDRAPRTGKLGVAPRPDRRGPG
jgi:hypothetical protein